MVAAMNTVPGHASRTTTALLAALMLGATPAASAAEPGTCVVLLHGLGRTPLSMLPLNFALDRAGYRTVNQGYPSLAHPIEELAATHIPAALARCEVPPGTPVHFVAHSMGGILVRQFLQENRLPDGSRMVMLGAPNHGSELIDKFADMAWFSVMGPAALQLGTDTESLPANLASVDLEIGIIAGTGTGLDAMILQAAPLPEPNDGKVSVASARLPEMQDFLAIDESHTFMLANPQVFRQVIAFLEDGRFAPEDGPLEAE